MLKKILTTVTILVAMLLIASPIMAGGPGGAKGIRVVPPTAEKRYSNLTAEWWQWALSFDVDNFPFSDKPDCTEEGQPDHVFFLAGGVGGDPLVRDCTVPSGSSIFFPIINTECSNLEPDPFFCPLGDEEACLSCNDAFYAEDPALEVLEVTIDGEEIGNLEDFRFQSNIFAIGPLPEGNIFDDPDNGNPVPAGTVGTSLADGYWIMLTPPSVGEHTVVVRGCFDAFGGCDGFEVFVQYNLTVVPRGQLDED